AQFSEVARDGQGAVTSDGDQRVQSQFAHIFAADARVVVCDFLSILLDLVAKRVAAVCRAQDGAAARQNPGNRFDGQGNSAIRPDQPVKAVVNADDSPAVTQDGGAYRAANNGIKPRAISASVRDADGLNRWSHVSSTVRQAYGA